MSKIIVRSLDPAFFDDRLHFSYIEDPADTSGRDVPLRESKVSGIVRIQNGGADPLSITSADLTGPFAFASPGALDGLTLAAGQFVDVEVTFDRAKYAAPTGATDPFNTTTRSRLDAVKTTFAGQLSIRSSDPATPVAEVDLAGFWQWRSENGLEANLNEIFEVFGFGNRIAGLSLRGGGQLSVLSNDDLYIASTPEEVLSPYWRIAPGFNEATMTTLAAYRDPVNPGWHGIHAPGNQGSEDLAFRRNFYILARVDSNSMLPDSRDNLDFATRTFTRATVPDEWAGDDIFGMRVEYVSTDPRLNQTGSILVDVNGVEYKKINGTQATDPAGNVVRISSLDLKQQGQWIKILQALDPEGRPIANTYIGAMDYPGLNYDYNDHVFLIEGVEPVGFGAGLRIDGLDAAASDARLAFSRIDTPDTRAFVQAIGGQRFRDEAAIVLTNDGFLDLPITSVALSGPGAAAFQVIGAPATLAAGASATVTVRFIGTDPGLDARATPYEAVLTFRSQGNDFATKKIALSGLAQDRSELGEEPTLGQIVDAFGYATDMGGAELDGGGVVERVGDEVLAPYLRRLDPSKPVEVIQLAAYLQVNDVARLGLFTPDKATVSPLLVQDDQQTQTLLPDGLVRREGDTGSVARATFDPTGVFGFYVAVDGKPSFSSWSDPVANRLDAALDAVVGPNQGHLMRYFVARDASGAVIPGTYILAQDYAGAGNFDYNDAVYVVRNVEVAPLGSAFDANRNGVADALETDSDRDGVKDFFDFVFNPPPPVQAAFTPDRAPWRVDADGLAVLARDYDVGGQDVAYFDGTADQLGAIDVRPGEAVDISRNPLRQVSYVQAGEWLEYTIFVEQAGSYDLTFTGATDLTGRSVTATFATGGTVYEQATVAQAAAGWGVFRESAAVTVDLRAGEQVMRVLFNQSGQDLLSFNIDRALSGQRAFTANGAPWSLDGDGLTLLARNFDVGGQNVAYFDTTPGRLGSTDVRPGEAVDISLKPERSVGYTEAGEWLEFTIDVETAGAYAMTLRGATPLVGRSMTASFSRDGAVYESATFTQAKGDWGVYLDTAAQVVDLDAGVQVLRMRFNNGSQDLLSIDIDPAGALFV